MQREFGENATLILSAASSQVRLIIIHEFAACSFSVQVSVVIGTCCLYTACVRACVCVCVCMNVCFFVCMGLCVCVCTRKTAARYFSDKIFRAMSFIRFIHGNCK